MSVEAKRKKKTKTLFITHCFFEKRNDLWFEGKKEQIFMIVGWKKKVGSLFNINFKVFFLCVNIGLCVWRHFVFLFFQNVDLYMYRRYENWCMEILIEGENLYPYDLISSF